MLNCTLWFRKPNVFNSAGKILAGVILCKNMTSSHYLDLKCFTGKASNPLFSFKCVLLDMIISILNPEADWHFKELFSILPHNRHGSNLQIKNLLAQPHVSDQRVYKHGASTAWHADDRAMLVFLVGWVLKCE